MPQRKGRTLNEPRPVDMTTGFQRNAEGSVLYRAGGTVVLATASIDENLPKWMKEEDGGWLTAEYQMHPRANPSRRENREGRGRPPKGRTMEIQRLIGRSLRSALDLKRLGARVLTVDCDVLEADGGTRTASITAGYVATAIAIHGLGLIGVLRDQIAAISVGFVDDEVRVDLDYAEDSNARVDMNIVASTSGDLVEVQGTAEGRAIARSDFDTMLDAGIEAVRARGEKQRTALEACDVSLDILMKRMS
ncbi:MAG: ribonuclease PH [Myxococcota bacterium]